MVMARAMVFGLRHTARAALRGSRPAGQAGRLTSGSAYGRAENMRSFLHHRPALGSSFRMNGLHTGINRAIVRNSINRQVIRPASYTAIPKLAFRVFTRLPVILAGGSVAGGAYVVTKVEAARSSVYGYFDEATSTLGNVASQVGQGVGTAFGVLGEEASDASDFGKSIWSRLRSSVEELLEGSPKEVMARQDLLMGGHLVLYLNVLQLQLP